MMRTPLVMFQEAPDDAKPWLVCRYSNAMGQAHSLVDLVWFEKEADARSYAHSMEHGGNR
jgi:hypothetical protein